MYIRDLYEQFLKYKIIQTDTRKIQVNEIFFALKGENFDGNQFIREALDKGASLVVSDDISKPIQHEKIIYVSDTLTTLQQLAKYHRQQLHIPIIAITGTNGKTTTKELTYKVLSQKYSVLATTGNLNNHIGIPLTLLKLDTTHQIGVIEMGASHLSEIAKYCTYVLPNYGLITNIGRAHLEGFGSFENVRKAKSELYQYIIKNDGIVFVNNEDSVLKKETSNTTKTFTYGLQNAQLTGNLINQYPFIDVIVSYQNQTETIATQLVGTYNFFNVLAACAIGCFFEIPLSCCKQAIGEYLPQNQRSQIVHQHDNTIILDAYNANPSSMELAIENFATYPNHNKVLILGAMKELGAYSVQEHQKIIQVIKQYTWQKIFLVGKEFLPVQDNIIYAENIDSLTQLIKEEKFHNTVFLIKGSRSMTMEKIVAFI